MKKDHYCIIMAGGVGSRFWPLSRASKPKQFLDILGVGRTLLQVTYNRFAGIVPRASVVALNENEETIVTGEMGLSSVRELFDFGSLEVLVLTRSRNGSTVFTRNSTSTYYPRALTTAIDPTGAGDAFLAVFCDMFFRGEAVTAAQREASGAAERVIVKVGSALEDVSL